MMYKITRLYTQGIRKEQEPVMAIAVRFGRWVNEPTRAYATTNGKDVVLALERATVAHIDSTKRLMVIVGAETHETKEGPLTVFQTWRIEDVE